MKAKELVDDLASLVLDERKAMPPGTIRTWGGYDYEKQKSGKWKRVSSARPPKRMGVMKHKKGKRAKEKKELADLKDELERNPKMHLPIPPPFEKHVAIATSTARAHEKMLADRLGLLKSVAPADAVVQGRVKEIPSAVEKVARQPDKWDVPSDLHDMTGTRVICHTLDDVAKTVDEVKATPGFKVISEDDRIMKPAGGYRSYHIIAEHKGQKFEMQIRTGNQHTWAEWGHEVFKPKSDEHKKALEEHAEEIEAYSLKLSSFFWSRDNPKAPSIEPPECPEVVRSTFGCMMS